MNSYNYVLTRRDGEWASATLHDKEKEKEKDREKEKDKRILLSQDEDRYEGRKKYKHEPCTHEDMPPIMKRDHIHSGYRFNYSFKLAFISGFFHHHNETGNIYTHLTSLLVFAYLSYHTYTNILSSAPFWEKVVFACFLFSAIFSYFTSTVWHVFGCHSETVYLVTLSFDYMGIALLTAGSFIPPLYFSFHCHPNLRALYIGVIGSLAIAASGLFVIPKFHEEKYNTLRIFIFLAMAAFSIFPVSHTVILFGLARVQGVLLRILLMFAFFAAGLVCYILKFPESTKPGYFDHWLHSHQIWHVLTFLGPFIHYFTVLEVYEQYLNNSNCDLYLASLGKTS